ncbi:MAG: SirB2 family protein [Pseudomonadales bacterium]|nr:SirB2 family protein [Halieaceae bacterium]MCP5163583.1 SirB2 family protein [Pseudomonadales bacterium]MCP5189206.1 SirB2 family protein [Pseudomonadales bacterium]MCP5204533.1 SirB2 family protein [Pseudomonadales bacterium]
MLFAWLKLAHVASALLSISGFTLRGYWMLTGSALLQRRLVKVLPHVIDTVLLGSAVGMLLLWQAGPLQLPWLIAKIVGLIVYIGLGMVALRFGRTRRVRATAFVLALLTAAYILAVAYSKSPWGLLAGG